MDPKVLSAEIKKEAKLLSRRLILLMLLVALIFIVLAGGFYYYKYLSLSPSIPFTNRGYQLHQTIAQIFKQSDKYNLLIAQTDKAILEKDSEVQYQSLTNLFVKFKQAYSDTKDSRVLAAMYQLRNYARALKDFKEEDFIIKPVR